MDPFLEEIFCLARKSEDKKKSSIFFMGIIKNIQKTINDDFCPLFENNENLFKRDPDGFLIVNYLFNYFLKNTKKKHFEIYFFELKYMSFLEQYELNVIRAKYQTTLLISKNREYSKKLIYFKTISKKISKNISKLMNSSIEKKRNVLKNIKISKFVEFEQLNKEILFRVDKIIKKKIIFWESLLNSEFNSLDAFKRSCLNLSQNINDFKKFFKIEIKNKKKKQKNILFLRFQIILQLFILNNQYKAQKLFNNLAKFIFKGNAGQIKTSIDLTIFKGDTIFLSISLLEYEKNAFVGDISTKFSRFFGFDKISNKNLDQFMMKSISKNHFKFIKNFIDGEKSSNLNKYIETFAKNQQNFIFFIKIYPFLCNHSVFNDFYISAHLTKFKDVNKTICFNNEGKIEGMTESFFNLLNFEKFDQMNFFYEHSNILLFFPQIFEIFEKYSYSHFIEKPQTKFMKFIIPKDKLNFKLFNEKFIQFKDKFLKIKKEKHSATSTLKTIQLNDSTFEKNEYEEICQNFLTEFSKIKEMNIYKVQVNIKISKNKIFSLNYIEILSKLLKKNLIKEMNSKIQDFSKRNTRNYSDELFDKYSSSDNQEEDFNNEFLGEKKELITSKKDILESKKDILGTKKETSNSKKDIIQNSKEISDPKTELIPQKSFVKILSKNFDSLEDKKIEDEAPYIPKTKFTKIEEKTKDNSYMEEINSFNSNKDDKIMKNLSVIKSKALLNENENFEKKKKITESFESKTFDSQFDNMDKYKINNKNSIASNLELNNNIFPKIVTKLMRKDKLPKVLKNSLIISTVQISFFTFLNVLFIILLKFKINEVQKVVTNKNEINIPNSVYSSMLLNKNLEYLNNISLISNFENFYKKIKTDFYNIDYLKIDKIKDEINSEKVKFSHNMNEVFFIIEKSVKLQKNIGVTEFINIFSEKIFSIKNLQNFNFDDYIFLRANFFQFFKVLYY